jgi:hypothetical protein
MVMKFNKPVYDAVEKTYSSGVKDGLRYEAEYEDSSLTPSLESIKSSILDESTALSIVDLTKSWFSKPITKDWLLPRLECFLPSPEVSFEGKCIWTFDTLRITKDKFILLFTLQTIPAEKICIEFPEVHPPTPVEEPKLPLSELQTRREQEKALVVSARLRAAKALFKAERLTQAYVQAYGETDWEDELEEDSEP